MQYNTTEVTAPMEKFEPKKVEKEVISMRISVEKLSALDQKAQEIGISRNELINQCIDFALSNMRTEKAP